MKNKKAAIEQISYVEAPIVLSSNEIDNQYIKKFGFDEGFLESLTGIRERRIWESDKKIHDIATLSAEKCIQESGIDRRKIGCIINCSVSLDYGEPSVAIMVHKNLKLSHECISFDISNACMGFSTAIGIIDAMIKTEKIEYGLIIAGESSKNVLDITTEKLKDPNTNMDYLNIALAALTLGSGSVSMLLTNNDLSSHKHYINNYTSMTFSENWELCVGELDRSELRVKSSDMIKEGIIVLKEMKKYTQIKMPYFNKDDIDIFIPHQVSNTHTKVLCDIVDIPKEKLYLTYPYLGNVGPASWPISLYLADKEINLKHKNIGILSMGSGFTISCLDIKW